MSPKIMLIAGEASGDLHGAYLVKSIRSSLPEGRFYGIGGIHMQREGVTLIQDISRLGVTGAWEVLAKLNTIRKVYRQVLHTLKTSRPDLLILIDYPDFNLRVARKAKKLKIPIVYYISPQVWAWRRNRIYLIARLVTKMIVIFPFEQELYQQVGVDVTWVGHPLIDRVKPELDKIQFCRGYGLDPSRPLIGLLPGSRENEIRRLYPVMRSAADLISKQIPQTQFILPLAPSIQEALLLKFPGQTPVQIIKNRGYEAMNAADLLIVASGTVTIEAALLKVPMIITYKVSPLTYALGKRLIRVPYIGMVNLVAGKQLAPELIQQDATPERIAQEAIKLLQDPAKLMAIREELAKVREKLGEPGASDRAAQAVIEVLKKI
ncbi:MAG TPA: lipid-A-disaccharide synthase [Candidatus Limnocylindrales bacterium]|nr:lipid-A-disaccharide synthase [Candidatus Limnocylindrales bacterium]